MDIFNDLRTLLSKSQTEVCELQEKLVCLEAAVVDETGSTANGCDASRRENAITLINKLEEMQNLKDTISSFLKSMPVNSSFREKLEKFSELLNHSEQSLCSLEQQLDEDTSSLRSRSHESEISLKAEPTLQLSSVSNDLSSATASDKNRAPTMEDFGIDTGKILERLKNARKTIGDFMYDNSENRAPSLTSGVCKDESQSSQQCGDNRTSRSVETSDSVLKEVYNTTRSMESHCLSGDSFNPTTPVVNMKPELSSLSTQALESRLVSIQIAPVSIAPVSNAPVSIAPVIYAPVSTAPVGLASAPPDFPVLSDFTLNVLKNLNQK